MAALSASPAAPLTPGATIARQRVERLEANVGNLLRTTNQLETNVSEVQRTLSRLEGAMGTFTTQVNTEIRELAGRTMNVESTLRQREEDIRNAFEQTAAQRSTELATIVAEAASEFAQQRSALQTRANAAEAEFIKVKEQLDAAGSGKQGKGFPSA